MRSDTASPARDAIGLIAGGGNLPLVLAKAVKARGHPLVCLALDDADASLVSLADHTYHVRFGQVEDVIAALRRHGARRVLMVGRVSRTDLVDRGDALFRRWLGEAPDRRDRSVFRRGVQRLHDLGVDVASPLEFAPELAVPADVLTRRVPTEPEWHDIRLGLSVARAVAALDAGQTVVLKRGVILAVEAAEGTDAAIRRGGGLAAGTVVVKAARPDQDPRFDLPTIGAQTVALLQDVGAAVLAVETGKTPLLHPPEGGAGGDPARLSLAGGGCFAGIHLRGGGAPRRWVPGGVLLPADGVGAAGKSCGQSGQAAHAAPGYPATGGRSLSRCGCRRGICGTPRRRRGAPDDGCAGGAPAVWGAGGRPDRGADARQPAPGDPRAPAGHAGCRAGTARGPARALVPPARPHRVPGAPGRAASNGIGPAGAGRAGDLRCDGRVGRARRSHRDGNTGSGRAGHPDGGRVPPALAELEDCQADRQCTVCRAAEYPGRPRNCPGTAPRPDAWRRDRAHRADAPD